MLFDLIRRLGDERRMPRSDFGVMLLYLLASLWTYMFALFVINLYLNIYS